MSLNKFRIQLFTLIYVFGVLTLYNIWLERNQLVGIQIAEAKSVDFEVFYEYPLVGFAGGRSKRWSQQYYSSQTLEYFNNFFVPILGVRLDITFKSSESFVDVSEFPVDRNYLSQLENVIIYGDLLYGHVGSTVPIFLPITSNVSSNSERGDTEANVFGETYRTWLIVFTVCAYFFLLVRVSAMGRLKE